MTERDQLAGHIVRRHADLDTDQAPRHIRQSARNPVATKLLTQNNRSPIIQANQMQRVLARIDANGAGDYNVCLLRHGDMLMVIRSPQRKPLEGGARPVHPIPRHHSGDLDGRYRHLAVL